MRRQIGWLALATTSMVVVSFVVPLCLLVRTMAEDRGRAAADQEARGIAILVASLHDSPQLPDLVASLDARAEPVTQVVLAGGALLGGGRLAPDDPIRAQLTDRSQTVRDELGYRITLPVVGADGARTWVTTSVTGEDLRHGVTSAWAGIIGVGVALTALALGLATGLARRISQPVRDVAEVAHRLSGGDLTARAEPTGPIETQELAHALNGLAERTTELLTAERAAVGDLSHRLRTPVTALRLDAEAVRDPEIAERLAVHIAVLQRTIDALVREARRPVATDLSARCDASWVVKNRVEFWSALAEDQGRPLEVDIAAGPLLVPLAEADLTAVVDVLIDNVFAHTSERVRFSVRLERSSVAGEAGCRVLVRDFATEPLVTDPSVDPVGRSGLGLDLVRRTAESIGGALVAGPADPGFEAVLQLPLKGTP